MDDVPAMVNLGKLHEGDSIGKPDLSRALALFRRAADAGNAEGKSKAESLSKRYVSPVLDYLPPH